MLVIKHDILLRDINEAAENNLSVEKCPKTKTIIVGGYKFYFYETYEERNYDYEIAERFVRLKNC